jgi:hypothetical protein
MADASRPERPGSTTHASRTPWRRGSWPDHRTGRGLLGGCASLLATPDPGLNVDSRQTPSLGKQPARQRVVFCPGCRRHGPELCPGPRGAALLWDLSPAGPSILGPYPLEGPIRRIVPWTWTGQTPPRAATYKYAPSGQLLCPRAGHRPILSRHEGRVFELIMRGTRRSPGLRSLGVSG